jgi:lipopolysaccharide transport system ATP-binding protein
MSSRERRSGDLALSVRGLSKAYTIRHHATEHITLAELALDRVRHPLRRAERERFWALRDASFDVRQGEVLSVIGRNGAGKSTLLKILSRITTPTEGEVRLWGRVGSLLEIGTGFHPELTGRENTYLNGAILGMKRREIDHQFDAIVDFAGVERFLDTPVKRYSSGMYVRLAFAIAAHLSTEILIVDEVLAVGDIEFQRKCIRTMEDAAHEGRTVLVVTHNMNIATQLAQRSLLLEDGNLAAIGPTDAVVARYIESGGGIIEDVDVSKVPRYHSMLGTRARIVRVCLNHDNGIVGADEDLSYTVTVSSHEDLGPVRISQTIIGGDGHPVGKSFGLPCIHLKRGCDTEFDAVLPCPSLAPGRYHLALGVGFGDNASAIEDLDVVTDSVHFEVGAPTTPEGRVGRWHESWGHARFARPQVERVETTASS